MRLNHGLHLAYCTNVHRGETWAETLAALERHTLAVKAAVCPDQPYAIGLRLSDAASRELTEPAQLQEFQRWLDRHGCYVFTINGFPFGRFHGTRVKERVYAPDWASPARLDYTNCLFDLLAALVPEGVAGSVSTLPGSFKAFIRSPEQEREMRDNLWRCVEHIAVLSERTGKDLHLGLEPEPFGFHENTAETIAFFATLAADRLGDPRLRRHLGVNYDACHFAVEFEAPADALAAFAQHGIRLSKLHLSNALRLRPTATARRRLAEFQDEVYLHQVIGRRADGSFSRYKDLDLALAAGERDAHFAEEEWRVHFHIPLHAEPDGEFQNTSGDLLQLLRLLGTNPALCQHLEMETYTWEVMPGAFRNRRVEDQIIAEYGWTLAHLREHGLAPG
jgi:sugar phosphate isomerase/epimerase